MRSILVILFLFSAEVLLCQNSFNGVISFETDIQLTENGTKKDLETLWSNYGNELKMFYLDNGNFARKYINSKNKGLNLQFYFNSEGILLLTRKGISNVDTLDVQKNSLKLIEKRKIATEKILGQDCKCYQYKAENEINGIIYLEYCYSEIAPKLNPELFQTLMSLQNI